MATTPNIINVMVISGGVPKIMYHTLNTPTRIQTIAAIHMSASVLPPPTSLARVVALSDTTL